MMNTATKSPRALYLSLTMFAWFAVVSWNSTASVQAQATWTSNSTTITTTASVGIGTTSPSRPLEVAASDGEAMRVYRPAYSINWGVNIKFALQNSNQALVDYAGVHGQIASNTAGAHSGNLLFTTASGGGLVERMRINSAGNIGLGTYDIENWTAATSVIESSSTSVFFGQVGDLHLISNAYHNSGWKYKASGPAADLYLYNGGYGFRIASSGSTDGNITWNEAMTIANSGGVGIGTMIPGYKLDVQGGQLNASGGLCIGGDCKTSWSQVGGSQWTNSSSNIYFNTGSVGLGTPAPGYKLDVQGGQLNTSGGLCIAGDCKTSWSQVGSSQWTTSSSNIYFNSGNVGIGTTGPAYPFELVSSATGNVARFKSTAASNMGIFVDSASSYNSNVVFSTAGANKWYQQNVGANDRYRLLSSDASGNGELFTVLQGGNVGINTPAPTARLHVTGDGKITGNLVVDGNIAAKYQDVAEWVPSSQLLIPGTVVVLDQTRSNQVIASVKAYDTRVAGVISAQPGIALGVQGEGKVLVATTGRVKVRVDATHAPIQVGDLLVTSDRKGVAIKSQPINISGVEIHRPGTLIGKALEPLASGEGEILVLLSLQ